MDILKGIKQLPSYLMSYMASLVECAYRLDYVEKDRCVICENKEVAKVFRQISHKGFISKEDLMMLDKYYPIESLNKYTKD